MELWFYEVYVGATYYGYVGTETYYGTYYTAAYGVTYYGYAGTTYYGTTY